VTDHPTTAGHHRMTTRRLVLRLGLGLLTVIEVVIGFWALVVPRPFYDHFPVPGHHWVDLLPPYNQHLIEDYGGLSLALGFVLAVATITLNQLLVRTILVGYLLYAVPHLVFHARHLTGFPTSDAVAQTVVLAVSVVLPLALLPLTANRPARTSV
jgi:hypothetical protein